MRMLIKKLANNNTSSTVGTESSNTGIFEANYNLAPSAYGAVYRADLDGNKLSYMKWGLIPQWVGDLSTFKANKTFNAREEHLLDSKMWKPCVNYKRCAVPISGYYEWRTINKAKTPYYITRKDGKLMFLAGLYDHNRAYDFYSFTIVTNTAPKELEWLHQRMPVVLEPGTLEWDSWFDHDKHEWSEPELNKTLKATYNSDSLFCYQVSKDVNKVENKGARLIKPILKEDKKTYDAIKKEESMKLEDSENISLSQMSDEEKNESMKQESSTNSEETEKVKREDRSLSSQSSDDTKSKKPPKKRQSIEDRLRSSTKKHKT
ncbi:hypothetical protein TPHA_0G02860 [Tetrapisispora phaffii CBS 4417]|uniref:Abasic site processing protein n=1 Tax=Tetrapisispora phaffii (strain ATCC 24235 / CBS 4417 / NBRC 1672 / NRRL Y-8282 / UCD 70-5) TaxID=1071381 RepID=G8BW46_TETPH|nr:hypothetical protein TPHA_0G02860 [Tetrapisispora phaffii CBS 4417]CCE64124.1 hypothetical protein TPHA_0G02860 [Tetrapisispora phaffii CBS 4417]